MNYNRLFLAAIFVLLTILLPAQSEILIVGTAHDVPEGMEKNYEPILKLVSKWNPSIICTEFLTTSDSLSMIKTYGNDYFAMQDSIALSWHIETKNAQTKIKELYNSLSIQQDLGMRMELRNLLYLNHDKGNARFQAHQIIPLFETLAESEKLTFKAKFPMYDQMARYEEKYNRDEFVLVVFPLALEKGITYLHPSDDQSLRDLYHEAWDKAHKELEDSKILADFEDFLTAFSEELDREMEAGEMLLSVNSFKSQELLYKIEYSFMPVGLNFQKDLKNYYYMDRNHKMAMNILEWASKFPNQKMVVFYGASHVPFIRKILKAESNHRILTLPDVYD